MPRQHTLDRMFLRIAAEFGELSNCVSHKVGCVIVKDNRIITTGYNGTPSGTFNCSDTFPNYDRNDPKQREAHHEFSEKYEIHAEENNILFAASHGLNINGGTAYCTLQPCNKCLKMLCQSGVRRVVYHKDYDKSTYSKLTHQMMQMSGLVLEQVRDISVNNWNLCFYSPSLVR